MGIEIIEFAIHAEKLCNCIRRQHNSIRGNTREKQTQIEAGEHLAF